MEILDNIILFVVKLTSIPLILGVSAYVFDQGMTKLFKIIKIYTAIFSFLVYDYARKGESDRMTYAKALEEVAELTEANQKLKAKNYELEARIYDLTKEEETPNDFR